jgi:F5/8 type C domain/Protein kinase domain
MGSPDFMSPEQILDLPVTPAIDVFALGSLAAFAATGQLPFGHGHIAEVAHRVVHEPPDLAGCPAGLVPLIQACLAKEPQARPSPSQILEFCVARAASPAGADHGQSRPAPVAIGRTPSLGAWSDHSATVVLPDPAQLLSPVRPSRQRLPIVAGLAAIALVAVVVAIAAASHLSAGRATAGGATATRHPVTVRPPARPHPVVRLSAGRLVTSSSVQPDSPWVAANAVDGNLGTRWSSAWSDPQWLEVDLGATHTVTKVVLYWERAYATAFQIQVSDDGTSWTDIYSTTTGTGGPQTLQVHGSGRYIRMYGTQRATQWGYSLWEFQVFGT